MFTKIFSQEGDVELQKLDCRECFVRHSLKQVWLPPPANFEAAVTAKLLTANGFCPKPTPLQILPDFSDTDFEVDWP